MTKQLWLGLRCSWRRAVGRAAASRFAPAGSAAATVKSFMQAVADSNLAKMASLWGTASGPASKTNQPPDWAAPRRRHAGLSAEPILPAYR